MRLSGGGPIGLPWRRWRMATTASPSWARLLQRVFALALAPCPVCQQGTRRLLTALTHEQVVRKRLRPLQRRADLRPIAPARTCQATYAWALR